MYELNQISRVMLVGLVPMGTPFETILSELEELKSLVTTFGGEVFATAVQKSHMRDKAKFVGPGKAEEIANTVKQEKIDIVVINTIASPNQLYSLEKTLYEANPKIKVWDRMDIILQIFAHHAHTREAKLQIDLARLRHMGPRTYGMGYILSRQGGGIGTVGIGETNTEIMKRHWRDEIRRINDELKKISVERQTQIEKRKNLGFHTVSLVGYTNAGKTMLFNRLTKKENYVSGNLFATLDSSVGRITTTSVKKNITLSDTIGFIKNLPPVLIDAFKSTLMETVFADVLLITVDISDPDSSQKLYTVDRILNEFVPPYKKRLYVFNKIDISGTYDRNSVKKLYTDKSPIFISAKTGEGVEDLLSAIIVSLKTEHEN